MQSEWNDYIDLYEQRPEAFKLSPELEIIMDYDKVCEIEKQIGRKIGVVYKSPYNMVVVDLVKDLKGNYFPYERIMPAVARGAIVSVPCYNHQFVLLRQYRHALRDYQYAFPRGYGEPDITVEENLKKEIQEEIHAQIVESRYLGNVDADSGLCGNSVSVYYCSIDHAEIVKHYEGIDSMVFLDEKEMENWIRDGKITDGYTLAAYSLYLTKFHENRE